MNFAFIGTSGALANATLCALADAGAHPTEVLATDSALEAVPIDSPFAVSVEESLASICHDRDINITGVRAAGRQGIDAALTRFETRHGRPDVVIVACLATILDAAVLSHAPRRFFNVHPSALPRHRGPSPVFWQLRDHARAGAVSVHRMTEQIDAGDVVFRRQVEWPESVEEPLGEALAGAQGGRWLADNLTNLATAPSLRSTVTASYQSEPQVEDFAIDATTWSATDALRFVRGTRWRQALYEVVAPTWRASISQVYEVRNTVSAAPSADGATVVLPLREQSLVAHGTLQP
jgi:methionyl-tRNA formyltransferase